MTRVAHRAILAAIVATAVVTLAAFLAFEDVARDPIPPNDVAGIVRWMNEHPGDWLTASALTDRVLDSSLERRVELWRAAHRFAARLAPLQPNANAAFVRSGLFHWYELGDADRRRVLEVTKPLLRDPDTFRQLAVPLWLLTRDFSLLRRNNPRTLEALSRLRELAITNGLFEDYRGLREELRHVRLERFEANPAVDNLYAQVPRPIEVADEPLLRRMLAALKAKPLESGHDAAPLIEYAIEHRLEPLEGLAPAVNFEEVPPAVRARLARALGMEETARRIEVQHGVSAEREVPLDQWTGTCGIDEVCTTASKHVHAGGKTSITIRTVQSDEVAPYVEIFVDDALRAEGAIEDQVTFEVPLGVTGLHEIEVRLANPLTRNRVQRRVALSP